MIERIKELKRQGDSCGGVIECLVRNVPSGLGMPVFDKLEADLANLHCKQKIDRNVNF